VKRLIDELDRQQEALYPPESNHLDPLDVLRRANVRFVVATLDGEVVGCGAVKSMADEYGEIKRMFVTPEVRGMGVGRAILADLEAHLIANGISVARLETGVHQKSAIALYGKCGYIEIAPFGKYKADPLSVFMEKHLKQ